MEEYADVARLMATTNLQLHHPFRYATMEYSGDARVTETQNTLFTFIVGSRCEILSLCSAYCLYFQHCELKSYSYDLLPSYNPQQNFAVMADGMSAVEKRHTLDNRLGNFSALQSI
jgi:hypothetical protein